MEMKLIFFRGCPTAELAKEVLKDAGLAYQEVCQNDLTLDDEFRNFTSPTLLKDGEIIFGSRITSGSSACSMNVLADLNSRLSYIKQRQ